MNKPLLSSICIFVLLLLAALPNKVYSQRNYQPGYIVKLNGDTANGLITYRNPAKTPVKIFFKTDETAEPVAYSPLELKGLYVDSTNFVGGIVKVNAESDDITESTPEYIFYTDTIFLQVLVSGEKPLYYINDERNSRRFYIRNNNNYDPLLFKKYLTNTKGNYVQSVTKKTYISQLEVYLSDCEKIKKQIQRSNYSTNELLDVFNAYYSCKNITPSFKKEKETVRLEFGAFAGISFSNLKVYGDYYLSNADLRQGSVNPTGGIYLDIILPHHFKNFSINNEIAFNTYQTTGHAQGLNTSNRNYVTSIEYTLGASYIKMNNMVRYTIPLTKSFFFMNLGISNGIAINTKNTAVVTETHFGQPFSKFNAMAVEDFKKSELGYLFGIGFKFNKFMAEARMDKGGGMISYTNTQSRSTRYSFLFGYRLF